MPFRSSNTRAPSVVPCKKGRTSWSVDHCDKHVAYSVGNDCKYGNHDRGFVVLVVGILLVGADVVLRLLWAANKAPTHCNQGEAAGARAAADDPDVPVAFGAAAATLPFTASPWRVREAGICINTAPCEIAVVAKTPRYPQEEAAAAGVAAVPASPALPVPLPCKANAGWT